MGAGLTLSLLPAPRRLTCDDCLANSSQCAWCQSTHTCFLFAAYLARYPHGGCRGWDDRYSLVRVAGLPERRMEPGGGRWDAHHACRPAACTQSPGAGAATAS